MLLPTCVTGMHVLLSSCWQSATWQGSSLHVLLVWLQVRASLTLYLPDDDVGAILGRKGQNLVEIQQVGRGWCVCLERGGGAGSCPGVEGVGRSWGVYATMPVTQHL
jgi:hypothetical protein